MSKLDSLTFFTLNAMADDWESIVPIEPQVTEFHCTEARNHLFDVFRKRHAGGFVRAMDENGKGTHESFKPNPAATNE